MSVVLITGCSTGIGRELARVCAAAGDRVFATMRNPSMAGDLEELDGVTILPLTRDGGWYEPNQMFMLPPSAFFIIGFMIWYLRRTKPEQVEKLDFEQVEVERSEQRA